MPESTTPAPCAAEAKSFPPNATAMRISTLLVLATDTPEKHFESAELVKLSATYREHIRALIPAIRDRALVLPQTSADRNAALVAINEAEQRLRLGTGDTDRIRGAVAVRLARSVKTLSGHYERLAPR